LKLCVEFYYDKVYDQGVVKNSLAPPSSKNILA